MPHLFVDISAHGLGHLAQVAPVVNALAGRVPQLELTIRSALPLARLTARLETPFAHIDAGADIGFHMVDALGLDHPANIRAYRAFHVDWARRVEADADLLIHVGAEFVLTDVAYLPLAAAARCGLPAAAMSSLNWADLFAHYYAAEAWAAPILVEMRAAYGAASFLRLEPAMPMGWLPRRVRCGPVAVVGTRRRDELCDRLRISPAAKIVAISLGGIPTRLPVERWLAAEHIVWLAPAAWQVTHPRCLSADPLGWTFPDLLASVDAVLTKPGYGIFAEAACCATPTAYVRRADWPEQEALIDWLHRVGRARELTPAMMAAEAVSACFDDLWSLPAVPPVVPTGIGEAAAWLAARLAPTLRT